MATADIIILGTIILFGILGFRTGLIHALGALAGTILGIYLAGHYYEKLAIKLIQFTDWNPNFVKVLVFILLFFIINRLIGIAFWIAGKLFSVVAAVPFLHLVDELLGGVLGVLEGLILVGIAIFFITKFPPSSNVMAGLDKSKSAPHVVSFSKFLWPLLPDNIVNVVNEFSGFSLPRTFGFPSGFSLPPGVTLPKDINDLKNFKLPASLTPSKGLNTKPATASSTI